MAYLLFPFAIDHVTVEEDGVEYTIVPYYQARLHIAVIFGLKL